MRRILQLSAALLLLIGLVNVRSAPASPVEELRVQKVGKITYFHVRLAEPKGRIVTVPDRDLLRGVAPDTDLTPRLTPADGTVRMTCARIARPERLGEETAAQKDGKADRTRGPAPVRGIEFVGRCDGAGQAKCKLLYAVRGTPRPEWKECEIVLDFDKAKRVPIPKEARERLKPAKETKARRLPPVVDDLEGLWATAQVEQFRREQAGVKGFGFYSFAASAIERRYGVGEWPQVWYRPVTRTRMERTTKGNIAIPVTTMEPGDTAPVPELYDLTTGSAAIAETLQMRRMNSVRAPAKGEKRELPVAKLRGIDVAEHPWKKMIGTKKPAPEPLAALVPHDNYYVTFKRLDRLASFAERSGAWGGNLLASYEVSNRDQRLVRRYERQLCLNVAELAKELDAATVTGVAITGSDAYLREGSDVAVLFRVTNRRAFDAAVAPYLADARKTFGDKLIEGKYEYRGVPIDRHVSPLREVSLYRAVIGDVVVYCNSPTGLRRLIDTAKGEGKRLSDSLDFQYMRTVFRHDDKSEDGFAFLSDAFIRQLVGPASKIKQRRRLEALASLHMLTHGAMLTRWESGKSPRSAQDVLDRTTLNAWELPSGSAKPLIWDAARGVAVSDTQGTIHFSTPLVEQIIDNVTRTEADEYERFRLEYMGLWRQYFDPIGMRVSLADGEVKMEAFILPLIENSAYNGLRTLTGNGSVRFAPSAISPKTVIQVLMHLNNDGEARKEWSIAEPGLLSAVAGVVDPIGKWLMVRVDDSPNYAKAADLVERRGIKDTDELARLVWSLPIAAGFDVKNKLSLAAVLATARMSVMKTLPGAVTWGPLAKDYKGVSIVRIEATARGTNLLFQEEASKKLTFRPAIYYALIDDAFFVTMNEDMMRRVIDDAKIKRAKAATVAVNSSLYLSPAAAEGKPGLITRTLEHSVHQQAMAALPVWEALYRCGVVSPDDSPDKAAEAAFRFLGYVPISPDGTAFRFDVKAGEVVNARHGSLRRPTPQKSLLAGSPVAKLLESIGSLRADLRFREDGIHTTLTLKQPRK